MDTVTLIIEGQPRLIVPVDTAREEFERLRLLELRETEDIKLFNALVVALAVLPKPVLPPFSDGSTRAEHVTAQWREKFKELNPA